MKMITSNIKRLSLVTFLLLGIVVNLPAQKMMWAFGINNTAPGSNMYNSNIVNDLRIAQNQDIYICGDLYGTRDFDPSGNSLILTSGNQDSFIAKYDSSGNLKWAFNMGDSLSNWEFAYSMCLDANDNVYVTGTFFNTVDFNPGSGVQNLSSNGSADIYFAKYNSNGTLAWAKSIGSTNFDRAYSIRLDDFGNMYLAGRFDGSIDFDPSSSTATLTSNGKHDLFIAKYDLNGNYNWAIHMGDTANQRITNMEIKSNGNLVVAGHFESTCDFDPGSGTASHTSLGGFDYFIASYDSTGSYIWSKAIGGIDQQLYLSMDLNSLEEIILGGDLWGQVDFDPGSGVRNITSLGNSDIFLSKYSSGGNFMWAESFGASGADQVVSVRNGPNDEILVSGNFAGTVTFAGRNSVDTIVSSSGRDMFLANFEDSAKVDWVFGLGGPGDDFAGEAAFGAGNFAFLGCSPQVSADFDPSPATYTISSTGFFTSLAKYAPCYSENVYDTICSGGYFIFPDGDSSSVSTVHTNALTSINTCDSIVVSNLTVLYDSTVVHDSICAGVIYTFPDNSTASKDTIHVSMLSSTEGCDSVITTILKVSNIDTTLSVFQGNTLVANSIPNASYQWFDCKTDNVIATTNNSTFTFTVAGSYGVIIVSNGCSDTSSCVDVIISGLSSMEKNLNVSLFPNPSSTGKFNLASNEVISMIQVMDIKGRTVFQDNETMNKYLIDISNQTTGFYILEIHFKENYVKRMKLILK